MPQRPKTGPPYTDIPKEIYVVVTYPWGMNRDPRLRGQDDFDRIASWAQLILQQGGLGGGRVATIECIYGMGTRDEIIIQFEEDTNIIPLLGEHRWAAIARNWTGSSKDPRSTRVFLYNWRDNGDPANHNWTENFPRRLPLDSVPAKSPYPPPSWTSPPNSLTNFVLPIPRPQIPPPPPDPADGPDREEQPTTPLPPSMANASPAPPKEVDQPECGDQPVAQDTASTSLFRPYEPPPQHPSNARFLKQQPAQSNEASLSQASPPSPKFVKKFDPYELEEDALSMLRSPNPNQEDTKDAENEELTPTPKVEHPEIKLEGVDVQHDITSRSSLPSQNFPPASLKYQPTAELEAYINAHLRGVAATVASGGGARLTPSKRVAVKREYEEDMATPLVNDKRIKIEEI